MVTALAFRLQESYTLLKALEEQSQAKEGADDLAQEDDDLARDLESTTFVTRQLLEIALLADYGDEIGRRKMFTLVRKWTC